MKQPLLVFNDKGIYCKKADVYIFMEGCPKGLRDAIKNKYYSNVPFSELAKEYSDDPSAKKGAI